MGSVVERCKKYDMYGMEFGLNYSGQETFKTHHGGCFSILVVLFVLNYTASNFVRMAYKEHPEVFMHYEPMSVADKEKVGIVNLAANRFNLAIQFRSKGELVHIPKNMAEIRAKMVTQDSETEPLEV